jgi:putative YhbY family RNA-binding protein
MKRHVRHELNEEGPTIWVGKEGLTPALTKQVEDQLDRAKMVKIRILKSALATNTAKTIATRTAEQVHAALVEVRGHVFIIYRRRKRVETNEGSSPTGQNPSKDLTKK